MHILSTACDCIADAYTAPATSLSLLGVGQVTIGNSDKHRLRCRASRVLSVQLRYAAASRFGFHHLPSSPSPIGARCSVVLLNLVLLSRGKCSRAALIRIIQSR